VRRSFPSRSRVAVLVAVIPRGVHQHSPITLAGIVRRCFIFLCSILGIVFLDTRKELPRCYVQGHNGTMHSLSYSAALYSVVFIAHCTLATLHSGQIQELSCLYKRRWSSAICGYVPSSFVPTSRPRIYTPPSSPPHHKLLVTSGFLSGVETLLLSISIPTHCGLPSCIRLERTLGLALGSILCPRQTIPS
jgi:hypothetical protein